MTEETMMRIKKELLKELAACKIVKRESYADVVKRLIDKGRKLRKESLVRDAVVQIKLPKKIL